MSTESEIEVHEASVGNQSINCFVGRRNVYAGKRPLQGVGENHYTEPAGALRKVRRKDVLCFGPSPAVVIAAGTGVKPEIINHFLKKGRLEIPEGSKYFLQCERCGCAIRYGRFCPECMRELTGGIRAAFHEDVGERPKNTPKLSGQYHFMKK